MTKARLYYETHITVKGKDVEKDWPDFLANAERAGWRASRFDVDEVDHYDGAWFLSNRYHDLDGIKFLVGTAIFLLEMADYEVIRWKIEDTVLDSKHGDTLDG